MKTSRHYPQRMLTAVAGNRASRAYLTLCAGLIIWVWVDTTLVHQEGASLAGIFPLLVTAPASMLIAVVPEGSVLGYYLVVVAAALVNAGLIGLCVRHLRGGHHPAHPADARAPGLRSS